MQDSIMKARGEGAILQLKQIEARLIQSCTKLFGSTPPYQSIPVLTDTLLTKLESHIESTKATAVSK